MHPTQYAPSTQPNVEDEETSITEAISYVDLINPFDARFEYDMPSLDELGLDKPVQSIQDLVPLFIFEFEKNYKHKVIEILRAQDVEEHYAFVVSGVELLHSNPGLFNAVINFPAICLTLMDKALVELMASLEQMTLAEDVLISKPNSHVRFSNLPHVPAYFRTSIPTSDDVGKLVSISATVTRSGAASMVVESHVYQCCKCRGTFSVTAHVDRNCQAVPPVVCLADVEAGCRSNKFKPVVEDPTNQSNRPLRSYQELKVQEQVNKLSLGTIPRSILVVMQDDLVDAAKPGDDVLITGVVRRRWKAVCVGDRCQIELYILACHVHVRNDARTEALTSPEQRKEFSTFWDLYQSRPLEGI